MLDLSIVLENNILIGESKIIGFENQVDVAHANHEIKMPTSSDKSTTMRTSGRLTHGHMILTVRMSKAVPKMLECCAKGENIGNVGLTFLRMANGNLVPYAVYQMSNVFIARIELKTDYSSVSGSGNVTDSSLPWYEVALDYTSIGFDYTEFGSDGQAVGTVSCPVLTGLGQA